MEQLFTDIFKADAAKHGAAYAVLQALKRACKRHSGHGVPASRYSTAERKVRKAFQAFASKTVTVDQIKDVAQRLAQDFSYFDYALDADPALTFPTEIEPLAWVKHPTRADRQASEPKAPKPKAATSSGSGSIFSPFKWF